MTADRVAGLSLDQLRFSRLADRSDLARAARMEHAAAGRVGGAGDLTVEAYSLPLDVIDARDRRQQRLGIRVVGEGEDLVRRSELHQPAEVQDGDAIGQ